MGAIELNRVRAAAPSQLWVAATNNMLRWDGQSWTAFNFDDPTYPNASASIGYFFTDIWIDSPASVWVASASGLDGQSWSLVTDAPAAARNSNDQGNTFVTGDATAVWLSTPGPHFFRRAD